jgi:hypothetical protein
MTTSQDHRVSKLYDALTPGEKAAAVFACIARFDTTTADRIVATVATKTYRMLDNDYRERLFHLGDLATFWGLQHWRELARMMAAIGLMTRAWHADKDALGEEAYEAFQNAQSRLVALDAMLTDICDKNGIDPEAVRVLAGVPDKFQPLDDLTADPDFDTEIRGILTRLAR